jgi:hypothetical protein
MSSYTGLKNADRVFLLLLTFVFSFPSLKGNAPEGSFQKGSFYFFWGYNRGYFGKSDIKFTGRDYNFTLKDVRSNDRQSKLGVHPYLEIDQMTIPQYNYRLGYCINAHYNISVGFDHMKYVMNQGQTVRMDGYIHGSGTSFDGEYKNQLMEMTTNFLQFEHTDGLNYIDAELSRTDHVKQFGRHLALNSMSGFGAGILCPRTRVVLLDRNVNDQWHVSGYGLSSHIGLNLTFYRHLFLQTTVKAGYINMPDIVTTAKSEDRAKQHFFFVQTNVVLGYRFGMGKK